jgi:Protein of unknown function (DUF1592)/Protein of unknown function (DUF1588)/Protein of unknown function (DUF1595)/Protein of unknown function (DUF1585)/Protein of unknown function (DUF1587)
VALSKPGVKHVQFDRIMIALGLGLAVPGCYQGLDGKAGGASGDASVGGTEPSGGEAGGSGEDESGGDDGVGADFEPEQVRLRLLLSRQYVHTIRDLLGEEAAAVASPPDDVAINGFEAVGASQLALTDSKVDAYEESARLAAAAATADKLASYHECVPSGPSDETCLGQFIERFGRLAFRRSLTDDELATYTAVALDAALDYGDFDEGKRTAAATFLQSPNFLYQVEIGEPTDLPGVRKLGGLEMATRLSYFLSDTTPDAELLDLAEAGGLDDADGVREAALALLESPAARQSLADFTSEVYRLRELDTVPKDPTAYPVFTQTLAAAMGQETLALVGHVAWEEDGDFRDVFDADYTFVNSELAALYGLPSPEQYGDTFTQVTLPPEQLRGGIFGNASLLSLLAHISTTSPTYRGKFVRQQILCQSIPAPPGNVDTNLPDAVEYHTMRERLEQHMSDPSCAACHKVMDPIGLGLENYDGVGQFRTEEPGGWPIDASSEVDGVPFAGAQQLGAAIKENPEAATCLVRNLFRHSTGHIEVAGELPELTEIYDAFGEQGYRMQGLLVELTASPAFRMVGEPD